MFCYRVTILWAKFYKEVKTTVYTAIISSAILCVVLMIFGIITCEGLLALIHTPNEIMADSKLYLDIYIWGLPFLFFYNIATGIFSALGDSKTPFIFLAVSSTSNILADIWFVKSFHMGIAGVAWATFLCQGISCVLAMVVVLKRISKIHTEGRIEIFSASVLKKITMIAVPSILQQSFISVGNIVIQSVINGFGPGAMAGYSAAVKLNNLVITSFTTLGNGISNYTAQNIGAGILPRVRAGFRAGCKMVWFICVPIVALYMLLGTLLVRFFMDEPSEMALSAGVQFLFIVAPFYFIVSTKLVADGILRGAGMMKEFMAATFTDLILRVLFTVILSKSIGLVGIWYSWPIGWTIAMFLSVIYYRKGAWTN